MATTSTGRPNLRLMTWARITATAPLAASPSKVSTAAFLLPERSTLVAPGLPDPKLRGSCRPMRRLTTTANGIEPSRYDSRIRPAESAADRAKSMIHVSGSLSGDSTGYGAEHQNDRVQSATFSRVFRGRHAHTG